MTLNHFKQSNYDANFNVHFTVSYPMSPRRALESRRKAMNYSGHPEIHKMSHSDFPEAHK